MQIETRKIEYRQKDKIQIERQNVDTRQNKDERQKDRIQIEKENIDRKRIQIERQNKDH